MRSPQRFIGMATLALLLCASRDGFCQATPPASTRVTGEHRLFLRFVEDAAIVPSYWLEGRARLTTNETALDPNAEGAGESSVLALGPIFAMNVAEDFEFGGSLFLAYRDPDDDGSDAGLTDLDLWGKLSVVSDPVKISLGILATLPTGDEDKFLGTGETNIEFFGGIRKDFSGLTLAGSAGLRINQDPEFEGVELEGKSSFMLGGAVLFPVGQKLVFSVEGALETERYEGLKNDSRLFGGFDWRFAEHFKLRGGAGGGLSDGAPGFEAQGAMVWLF